MIRMPSMNASCWKTSADLLRPVYERTNGRDGYVSLELSPALAHDTPGSIAEARRLFGALACPNVMIKFPATPEGIPAIEALIAEGINVNITLIFSLTQYETVAEAYLSGLERRAQPGSLGGLLLHQPGRYDGGPDVGEDWSHRGPGPDRDRQGQNRLPALQGDIQRRTLGKTGCRRRAGAAAPVSQHRRQEHPFLRYALRSGFDRAGYGKYHAAGHAERFPGSRPCGTYPGCRFRPGICTALSPVQLGN